MSSLQAHRSCGKCTILPKYRCTCPLSCDTIAYDKILQHLTVLPKESQEKERKVGMKDRLYIASVSTDAPKLANEYGIGLELDHYCTAENMDPPLAGPIRQQVQEDIRAASGVQTGSANPNLRMIFHAPFNELCPAAIDPKIKEIASERYEQAYCIAKNCGISKMVAHSGYMPYVYYKVWHHEKSVEFWKRYMKDKPKDFTLCIENVLEDEPYMMAELMEEIAQPNIRLCLDLGHANCMSRVSAAEWLQVLGPYISHLHIHNNDGTHDFHGALTDGSLNMTQILEEIDHKVSKTATITIESLDGRASLEWMEREGYLK